MYTCTCKPLFIIQCCRRNCNRSKLIVRILTTNKMSLREHLVKRMWWLGWRAESNKSISRRKNVLPGRQTKQIKFSFPISNWSCRFVHYLRERQVRSKSMISWRRDSVLPVQHYRAQSLTVQVQGPIVLDGLVVKPGSLQAWSMVWRLLEHTGSGAGGPHVQKSSK